MDRNRLEYLFKCYRKSNCTKEELEELNLWFESFDPGEEHINDLISQAGSEEQLANQLYQNFSEKAIRHKKSSYTIRWWSVAAATIALLGIALLYNGNNERPASDTKVAQAPILPGTDKAILTLIDGTRINLDNKGKGKIYDKDGLAIFKTDSGSLAYQTDASYTPVAEGQMRFNSLYVPRGGQYKVTMPDGTKVWLNSNSTFRFPVTSNGKDRLVSLTGEGYFEVAHNKNLPFKVRTADQEVQVLGTHFNIKGYDEEELISTTLIEGSVKILKLSTSGSKLLFPSQQAGTSDQSTSIDVRNVNIKQVLAWKNGYFIFDNEDIRSIMKAISRWYDVDVEYVSEISKERFGGTFSRRSSLSEILDNLQELGDVQFNVKDRKVIVSTVTKY